MASNVEKSRSRPPVLKKAAAGRVLIAVAALVVRSKNGLVFAVSWFAAVIAVIVSVLWALKTIVW